MAGPWTSLEYDWSYWETCANYTLRDQTSWDFVLCEGNKGWPSAHVTLPFITTLLLGNPLLAFLIQGTFEIFEAIVLLLFKDFIIFDTLDVERETLLGSVGGDWFINGGLGVLAAYFFMDAFDFPSFMPPSIAPLEYLRNIDWAQSLCPRVDVSIDDMRGDFCPPISPCEEATACCTPYAWNDYCVLRDQMALIKTGTSDICHALYWFIRVKTWFFWKLIMLLGIFITIVHPHDCLHFPQPYCRNTGIMITTVLQVIVLESMFF